MAIEMRYDDKPPPAPEAEIADWERFAGVAAPADYRALLRESNGPILWNADLRKELQFFAAREVEAMYDAYRFGDYLPEALPICLDGAGVFAIFWRKDGRITGVYAAEAGVLFPENCAYIGESVTELIAAERRVEDFLRS